MKPYSIDCLYDYLLTPESVVLDCGGYEGNFSKQIYEKFKCKVIVFEPVSEFFGKIASPNPDKVFVHNVGIGDSTRIENFLINGDMSGLYSHKGNPTTVKIMSIRLVSDMVGTVDLLKLNIEGMEYEVLNEIIGGGIAKRFKNIQIQFHHLPYSEARIETIRKGLSWTHRQTFCEDYVWEGWTLK